MRARRHWAALPPVARADALRSFARVVEDHVDELAALEVRQLGAPDRSGVKSGVLSVNSHASVRYSAPFGGMKNSGLGRELGPDAIEHFTETKNVYFATDAS